MIGLADIGLRGYLPAGVVYLHAHVLYYFNTLQCDNERLQQLHRANPDWAGHLQQLMTTALTVRPKRSVYKSRFRKLVMKLLSTLKASHSTAIGTKQCRRG